MKSQIKQLTPVETFKPITLEIQIETLDDLRILRGLWGANRSVAFAVVENAASMTGITVDTAASLLTDTFKPLERHYERLLNGY